MTVPFVCRNITRSIPMIDNILSNNDSCTICLINRFHLFIFYQIAISNLGTVSQLSILLIFFQIVICFSCHSIFLIYSKQQKINYIKTNEKKYRITEPIMYENTNQPFILLFFSFLYFSSNSSYFFSLRIKKLNTNNRIQAP